VQLPISDPSDIGAFVRAARKAQGIRQDDAAGAIGVSENFMVRVENGAEGIQWGKLFQVLSGLGIRMLVDVPEAATGLVAAEQDNLRKRRARSSKRRATAAAKPAGSAKDQHG
jgi:transcriptional regulator with XRE-family HTH domain